MGDSNSIILFNFGNKARNLVKISIYFYSVIIILYGKFLKFRFILTSNLSKIFEFEGETYLIYVKIDLINHL